MNAAMFDSDCQHNRNSSKDSLFTLDERKGSGTEHTIDSIRWTARRVY